MECMMELNSGMLSAVESFWRVDLSEDESCELIRVRRTASKSLAFPAE